MEKIKQLVQDASVLVESLKENIEYAEQKRFTYNTAKDMRKTAQEMKKTMQDLRIVTLETYKSNK